MDKRLDKRLEALEVSQGGGVVVVRTTHDDDWRPLSLEAAMQRMADARRRAGPGGLVIELAYVDNWRPDDGQLS